MTDYAVDALSIEKIEECAKQALTDCPRLVSGAIDVLKALRMPRVNTRHGTKILRLKLVPDKLLPEKLAQVWARGDRVTVTVRMSLWNKAEESDVLALKELRHEFSHVYLHSGARTNSAVTLDRQIGGNSVHNFIDPDRRVENQANWLAACLAMPQGKIHPSIDVRDVSAEWNVSIEEATWRLEQVRLVAPKRIPESIKRNIESLRIAGRIPVQAQALWDRLPSAPESSPTLAGLVDGFLIEYCEYNRYTQTGWALEGNKIVALMSKMHG